MHNELERIERRLIEVDRRLVDVERDLLVVGGQLKRVIELLEEPTTYPQSTGGTITVT